MPGWLADFFRLLGGLFYWNARKTVFHWRGGRCPCQNPSDSGRALETTCDACLHWHQPAPPSGACVRCFVTTPNGLCAARSTPGMCVRSGAAPPVSMRGALGSYLAGRAVLDGVHPSSRHRLSRALQVGGVAGGLAGDPHGPRRVFLRQGPARAQGQPVEGGCARAFLRLPARPAQLPGRHDAGQVLAGQPADVVKPCLLPTAARRPRRIRLYHRAVVSSHARPRGFCRTASRSSCRPSSPTMRRTPKCGCMRCFLRRDSWAIPNRCSKYSTRTMPWPPACATWWKSSCWPRPAVSTTRTEALRALRVDMPYSAYYQVSELTTLGFPDEALYALALNNNAGFLTGHDAAALRLEAYAAKGLPSLRAQRSGDYPQRSAPALPRSTCFARI